MEWNEMWLSEREGDRGQKQMRETKMYRQEKERDRERKGDIQKTARKKTSDGQTRKDRLRYRERDIQRETQTKKQQARKND